MKLVDRYWQQFEQKKFKGRATDDQLQDAREAFYLGALAIFMMVQHVNEHPLFHKSLVDRLLKEIEPEITAFILEIPTNTQTKARPEPH